MTESPTDAEKMIRFGLRYVGTPYKWGGSNLTKGIDSSHLVQQLYRHIGITLNAPVRNIENQGRVVHKSGQMTGGVKSSRSLDQISTDWDDLRPGDVLIMQYGKDLDSRHCGIYLGKSFDWSGKEIEHAILNAKRSKGVTVESAHSYDRIYKYAIRVLNDDGSIPVKPKSKK